MKLYELYLILKPSLNEAEVNSLAAKITELLAKAGFNVGATAVKSNERLTYNIKHFRQAHILTLDISGGEEEVFPETVSAELGRDENILRHFVMAKSEKMILKRAKQASLLNQLRRERKTAPAAAGEGISVETPAETPKADIAEIDKKLEEILK